MSAEIAAELREASNLPQSTIDKLIGAGVSPGALAFDHDGVANVLTLAPVVFQCCGAFEFVRHLRQPLADEVVRAFVFMARDIDGRPVDLVAWSPRRDRVAVWRSDLPLIGMEQVGWSYDMADETLPVHPHCGAWLKANRRGVVILDHRAAAPWLHLARPLSVPTPLAGELLREALTVPAPRIVVEAAA